MHTWSRRTTCIRDCARIVCACMHSWMFSSSNGEGMVKWAHEWSPQVKERCYGVHRKVSCFHYRGDKHGEGSNSVFLEEYQVQDHHPVLVWYCSCCLGQRLQGVRVECVWVCGEAGVIMICWKQAVCLSPFSILTASSLCTELLCMNMWPLMARCSVASLQVSQCTPHTPSCHALLRTSPLLHLSLPPSHSTYALLLIRIPPSNTPSVLPLWTNRLQPSILQALLPRWASARGSSLFQATYREDKLACNHKEGTYTCTYKYWIYTCTGVTYMYARQMLFIVGESLSKLKGLDVIQLCAVVCTYMHMLCYVYVESV